ncbi:MAG: hypothetical protein EAY75_17195 [Bacteroidetes bacterium]|nr:MAG: hypothetical protein EAY75_17195 [Bacteroidota bacterium]
MKKILIKSEPFNGVIYSAQLVISEKDPMLAMVAEFNPKLTGLDGLNFGWDEYCKTFNSHEVMHSKFFDFSKCWIRPIMIAAEAEGIKVPWGLTI